MATRDPRLQPGDKTVTNPNPTPAPPVVNGILTLVTQSLADDQAQDVRVIALAGKSQIADHMVIASGRSARQLGSMADKLRRRLKQAGINNVKMEGRGPCHWILLDAGDVIVHLFRPDTRELYALEKLWDGLADPHPSASPSPEPSLSEPSGAGQ